MTARTALVKGVLRSNAGRTRLMIAAIAVGVGAVGAILGSHTVIERTIEDSYASTQPADATLTLTGDAVAAEAIARDVTGVTQAEARREVTVRMASAEGWQPLTLIAVADFAAWDIGIAFAESGNWPPQDGEIVLERASLQEVDVAVGDSITAQSPGGEAELSVVGLAHDPGRTPAWMTGQVIGLVSPGTLADIGVGGNLTALALRTAPGFDRDTNSDIADATASALTAEGFTVTHVAVPEPGEHPAAGVMGTLLYLLQAFGVVAFVAAVALVSTLVVAEVKRSTGMIAVMKTGGATSGQVARVYVTALAAVATAGLVFGIGGAMAGTWALSSFAFTLLNLDATSMLAAWWVFPVQAAVALVVPLAAVGLPVRRLSRIPVRESIVTGSTAPARAPRRTVVGPRWGRAVSMGGRNAWRQPGRLVLTGVSLGVGAAAVITALNTGAAWDRIVADEFRAQDFDVQARLTEPIPRESLDASAAREGLARLEYWNTAVATVTGPDGQVGDVAAVLSPPADSTSATFPLVDGRQLSADDDHAVVVSQSLADPELSVGDTLTLEGDDATWTVVGVVRQLSGGLDGTVWVSEPLSSMNPSSATVLRVTGEGEDASLAALERVMEGSDASIEIAGTATDAKQSLDDHLYIITGLLLVMSIGLGAVGLLALVEAMSTAVAERRGEIGLMKSAGAQSRAVIRMVVIEALVVVGLALLAGVALATVLTGVVESAVGAIFTGAALPYTWWWPGVALTALVMTAAAAASSIVPAYEAADMPIREALAQA